MNPAPPSDYDLQQMVELGLAARALGESPTFNKVVNHLTNIHITTIFTTRTSAARDEIYYQQHGLEQILGEIQRLVNLGAAAAEALAERDEPDESNVDDEDDD